jgi:FixJ family two-component response regulator
MSKIIKKRVFIVDDEPAVLKAISQTVSMLGCHAICFGSPGECLDHIKSIGCDLLISDINMPGYNGIQLLEKAREVLPLLPVLIITGYGDIPLAVKAVKAGALDFLEKPLDEATLIPAIVNGLRRNEEIESIELTEMERKILIEISGGLSNREVADKLGRSIRTIENHRLRIMRKLNADSHATMIKMAIKMGLCKA